MVPDALPTGIWVQCGGEAGVVRCGGEVGVVQCGNEVGVVKFGNEVGVVKFGNEVGVVECGNEVGVVECGNEVGVVECGNEVGVAEVDAVWEEPRKSVMLGTRLVGGAVGGAFMPSCSNRVFFKGPCGWCRAPCERTSRGWC